jgi:hypothetical protein
MRGLRAKRVRTVKEGTLIATVDMGVANNTGYCTTLDGRSTKSFRFDNTKEGFEKFWCMTIASKNRFGCDEVLVGYESTGPYAEPLVHYLANKQVMDRMNAFWGDDSWRGVAYTTKGSLFGFEEKVDNETIAEGFRKRLLNVAGFKQVPSPLPMRNSRGTIIYYLFFASQKPVAMNIVQAIFNKYRQRGVI